MRHGGALVFFMVLGCDRSNPEATMTTSTATRQAVPSTTPVSSKAHGGDIVAKICASATCTGDFASVQIWHGDDGAVGRYVYDGDVQACSHPPRIYFDASGKETLHIGMHPVASGSDEARALSAKREAQVAGLEQSRRVSCPARE